jgi:hypothetical protein
MVKKIPGIKQSEIDKVLHSDLVNKKVGEKAVEVWVYWRSIAPVFGDKPPHRDEPAFGNPGDYRDSLIIKNASDDTTVRWRVKPTDAKMYWIEFGTRYRADSQKPGGSRSHGRGKHSSDTGVVHMPEYGLMAKVKAHFRKP